MDIEQLSQRVEALESVVTELHAQGHFWVTLSVDDAQAVVGASLWLMLTAWALFMIRKTLD